ncbi:MAG: ABC transporter permease [Candidatus Methanoplasma sp.]|jgi:putative ABC transport system permease protein|nr:ABC transporter permease [Candidatus Methanoplasma sp.]
MNVRTLSVRNLSRRPFRTVGLITVVAVLAFSLFAGSLLEESLENGAENVKKRLGADVMLVPKGSGYDAEAILLKGEPNAFYMDKTVVDEIVKFKGISEVTTQFYLTTVSDAECCDFPVQLISFDPETDFTVTPWIEASNGGGIGHGELVVGSAISLVGDNQVKLFGNEFPVAARLGKSGTGLDTSIYMTQETMKDVAKLANDRGYPSPALDGIDSQISTVLIKAEPGYDTYLLVQDIRFDGVNVDVIKSTNITAGLTQQMGSLIGYVKVFEVMLWLLAVVVLGVLFSVSVNERKKEFATFRMMGATRRKLSSLILGESSLVSAAGALLGAALAALFVLPFSDSIGSAIGLPYLAPSLSAIASMFVLSVAVAFAIGPLAAIWSARRIGRSETHSMFTEGN